MPKVKDYREIMRTVVMRKETKCVCQWKKDCSHEKGRIVWSKLIEVFSNMVSKAEQSLKISFDMSDILIRLLIM